MFKEKQKFGQIWLWCLLATLLVFSSYKIIKGFDSSSNFIISFTPLLIIGVVIILFVSMRLETTINREYIKLNYFPFLKKEIKKNEIKRIEVLNYGFVGGWGIRFSKKYGTVYNLKGSEGIYIELQNGKKLTIGTQKKDEVSKVLNEFF